MAKVTVKLFGVYRMDTHVAALDLEADRLDGLLEALNRATEENKSSLSFRDATIFINGENCKKKKQSLKDGDEVWLLSPASGG